MDYRAPIAKRTRSKRDEAILKLYWEKKTNNEWGDAGSKKRRRYECASGSQVGESSSRERFEHFKESSAKISGKQGKRERDVIDLVDSDDEDDDEVVVSASEEGDDDDVDETEEEEDVSSAAKDDSCCEETLFSTDEETEEEDDEEYASLSEVDTSEDENEEGIELTEKSQKAEEKVEIGLRRKRNANGGDLHSSSGHDIDDKSKKAAGNEEIVEVGTKGKGIDDGDGSEKVWKEGSVEIGLKENLDANGDDVHSSSRTHNVDERSVEVGEIDSVSAEKKNECENGNYDDEVARKEIVLAEEKTECEKLRDGNFDGKMGKEESVRVGSVGNENGDRNNLHSSSVHHFYDRCDNEGKANTVYAEEKTIWNNKRGDEKDGKIRCDNSKSDVRDLAGKKSTRRPRTKWLPTVEFVAPKVQCLPQQWSLAEPATVIEMSEHEREIDALFSQFISADMADANGSTTDSKAAENNFTRSRSDNDSAKNKTCVGKPGMDFNEGKINDLQTTFKKNEEAIGSSFTRSINDFTDTNHAGTSENASDISRKTAPAPKASNAFTILVDSIYRDEQVLEEQIASPESEAPKAERPEPLPQYFSIADPPTPAPEKSAFEKELDELFDEYNFLRVSEEIGYTDENSVEDTDIVPPGTKHTQIMLCNQGKHRIILDEEVGLLCEFCPYVEREIKYIVPDFAPNPYGFVEKRKNGEEEEEEEEGRSIFNDIHCNVPEDRGTNSDAHAEGTVWDLIPGLENDMYPHQREGFEFIWSHIAGGIELGKLAKPSAYEGDGCIISHAPGTGKTRLTIVFIQSYMKFNPKSRPLIVAPRTMLLTWEEEFKKWGFDIPFHNLNNLELSGKEDAAACNLMKDVKGADLVNANRIVKLKSWIKSRSILGISYTLFEKICEAPNKEKKRKLSDRKKFEFEEMGKLLLEFPGLVVFDEGHNPRSEQSYSWNALLKIKTKRRILLSGTPFQNNFDELDNTIHLVRPETTVCLGAGDKKMQGRKNNAADIANENVKRAKVIREMISPFVHVYKGTILQDKLPGLRNSVVVLEPTELQQRFSNRVQMITNPFQYERLEAKISIHPSLLIIEKSKDSSTLSSDEDDKYADDMVRLEQIKLSPEGGVKAKFTIDLIRLCQPLNERVLIFSQWLDPLTIMRDILKSQFQWAEGVEIVYMDGKCDGKQRQSSMSYFNNPSSKAKVLLASTKSCNEGINLVGASRVVLLDVTWNPAVERQAISRAYRLGQKKIVFIYHLLMAGAREEKKYTRQVEKHRLSELVFSCSSKEADAKNIRAAVAEDKILEEMVQHEKLKHIFQKITLLDGASYLDEHFEV